LSLIAAVESVLDGSFGFVAEFLNWSLDQYLFEVFTDLKVKGLIGKEKQLEQPM